MLVTDNNYLQNSKSPICLLAVGILFAIHLACSGAAGAQAINTPKSDEKIVAPQLSSFYRNEFESPLAGEPFSAVEDRVTAFRATDGKLENRSVTTTHISRDSAGRVRIDRERVTYDGNGVVSRAVASYVADPISHSLLIFDPTHRTALELPWDEPATPATQNHDTVAANDASEIEVKVESLGVRHAGGLTVDGSLRELSVPVGSKLTPYRRAVAVSIETWVSRDLNVSVFTRSETSSGEISTTTLKDISRAEPSKNLFELPADYVLTSPGSDTVFALAR